ncbi:MAG TPA: ATP-binding protein, partial [Gemmatimonadales bacterium]|nr:ATP-binding protein [Gemmatimonadales bacterium]
MPVATSRRLSSIERQALLSGALVLLSVLALLLIAFLGFDTLSSARAYVGGEGLWSKAQKDAVYHLTRYATGRDPADFEAFRQSLTVPLGDRLARVELQRRDPEWDSVRAGFLRGRNNSEDIPGMGRFFRRFHSVDFVAEAVSDWTRGDSLIDRLAEVGEQLHREIQGPAPDPVHIRESLAEIHILGQALTRFEDHFSAAIGAGARWASRVLAVLVAVTAALILVIAGMTLRQTTRRFTVAEAARKASDEELRELVRHARIGISRTSLDGRFLAANPALVRMLGYDTESELLALDPDRDLYDQPAEQRAGIDRLLADGVLTTEVRLRHRSGSLIQVRSHSRLIRGPDGAPAMIEGFLEDVTQQRRLEAQLRQGQKLEAVGQLTGGIAHEFNNLLTVILSTAKLLEEHLPEGDHTARADLADLTAAARRGADMIRQLLALSRDRQLQFQPQDLGRLVEAGAAVLRRLLEPGIEVQVEVRAGAPLVRTDPFSIEQILLTLATNARDALPRGGVLRIITGPAPPDPATGGARALLEVSDNGLGMDAATRERLFEPFFTTKPAGQGTGLGLTMVQGLVKQ